MKTYYLVSENLGTSFQIKVSDAPNGEVLKEFSSESYSAAVKMFSFSATNCGKTAICGVSTDGKPYTDIC